MKDFAPLLITGLAGVLSRIARFGVPVLLVIAALTGAWVRASRARRLSAALSDPLRAIESMSWMDFEKLLADAFRREGFKVSESGGPKPDGGVDLRLRRDGQVHLVQAKHWRTRSVGVKVVRELYGVMVSEGAAEALVVTAGSFTAEAREFARGKPVTLLDGPALSERLRPRADRSEAPPAADPTREVPPDAPSALAPTTAPEAPSCPSCGAAMIRREARKGARAGSTFWGCPHFPKCRGTREG